ncbi:nitrilase/cyanide hydratase and apolipo protein N-acyltransferase [Stipitochalara longipes BDJ]|nr:nitrilase/cyanide hydratase and apolipo protein N-acyltransferase [Stipitochalara longipes BDJ]
MASTSNPPKKLLKLAAVQAAPIFLNKLATTEKACALILEAGRQNADIIGFPETFIPGYPGWVELLSLSTPPATTLFTHLFAESIEVPGPETAMISAACKQASIYAVIGINERRPHTTGTLWNTQLFFSNDGTLLHKHQKFVPTKGERLVHAPGTTGSKASMLTDFGAVSALACGENGNPLAQYSVGLEYPVVHVASWPPHFCPGGDVRDASLLYTRALASSLGCFVINSVAVVDEGAIDAYGVTDDIRAFLGKEREKRGATIVGPGGAVLADGKERDGEEILYAEVDAEACVRFKYVLDYAGHYNRPEIFAHHFKEFL